MQRPSIPLRQAPSNINPSALQGAPVPASRDTYGVLSTKGSLECWRVLQTPLDERQRSDRYAYETDSREFLNKMLKPFNTAVLEHSMSLLQDNSLFGSTWTPGTSKGALYKPLERALRLICSEINNQTTQTPAGRLDGTQQPQACGQCTVVDTNVCPLRDSPPGVGQYLDLGLATFQPDKRDSPPSRYNAILLVVTKEARKATDNQSALRAVVSLHCQLHLWDGSGHLSSSSFSIYGAGELAKPVTLVGRLSLTTLKEHGFDSTALSRSSYRPCHPLTLPYYIHLSSNDFFHLDSQLLSSTNLLSKEMRCWNAAQCLIPTDETRTVSLGRCCFVKGNWLHEEQAIDLPQTPDQPVNIERLEGFDALLNDDSWGSEGLDIPEGTTSENWGFSGGREVGIYAYLKRAKTPGLAEFGGAQKLEFTLNNNCERLGESIHPRLRYRVILFTVGRPLREASSPAILLSALRDIVDGLEGLLRRGIFHRDISDTNCLLDPLALHGFLIDLDQAISISRLQEEVGQRRRHCTGTLAFMATGLLFTTPEIRTWAHDYESIFWLLLYICAGSPIFHDSYLIPGDGNDVVLGLFMETRRLSAYYSKRGYLYGSTSTTTTTHLYYEALGPCLNGLRTLLLQHRVSKYDPRSCSLDRKAFRAILTDWIDKLEGVAFPTDL